VYEVELDEILSSIKISLSENKKTEGTLVFISKNEDMANKWRDFLNTFEDTINKKTQKYLKEVINNKIRNAKIEQINKVKDIESEINASLKYYEINTKSRLSFLEEQAEIAREGNITNKISAYSPEANNSIHYNKSLYYLRGYIMIQKEIELIKKRKDPYLFAKNVTLLQARKLKIENDETIIRQEAKFNTTPIFNTDSFLAGSIESTSIQQIKNNPDFSTKKIIILAILIGFITGVFYVTISHSIRKAIIRDGRY
jgi:LPS O-antigen subunit length determinant protein (WzzB/FepE family)